MAYGVVGVSTPTVLHAQSVQGPIPQTTETLNETPQTDTTASIQMAHPADQQHLDSSADAEIDHRFNELRREFLDDRARNLDRWLGAIALFLTVLGFLGYWKFRQIEKEAREATERAKEIEKEAREVAERAEEIEKEAREIAERAHVATAKAEESANQARRFAKEAEKDQGAIAEMRRDITAESAADNPAIAQQAVDVSKDPQASLMAKAIAHAIALQKAGETERAIKIWKGIAYTIEEIDHERAARAWLSVSYLENTRGDKTNVAEILFACDQAIRLKPNFPEAYTNRGSGKAMLGHYKDAIADYDRAIFLNPNFSVAYHNRGNVKAKLAQYDDAIVDYSRAIELNPNYAEAYHGRGDAKDQLGQSEEAITDFDRAIELKPNDATIFNDRGAIKAKLGRVAEARVDFEKARDIAKEAGNVAIISFVERNLRELEDSETT